MNLKLEAISRTEGIGILRVGKTLRLMRPPYRSADTPVLPEGSVEDAVLRHGFSYSERQFESWQTVIKYLNDGVREARRAIGQGILDEISADTIFQATPPEVLEHFLDRVEKELIPQHLYDEADDFLLAALSNPISDKNSEFKKRAVSLLQKGKIARKRWELDQNEMASRDIRFVSLEQRGELEFSSRLAETIRERGCVFA